MRFEEALALMAVQGQSNLYITHEDMVSGRHAYVRVQEHHQALKLVHFKTGLEQDWVPSLRDLTRADWQVLEDK